MNRPELHVEQAEDPSTCSDDHRYLVYGEVAEQIEAAIREGRAPDLAALEQQHPDMGDEIRKFAEALKLLDDFGGSVGSPPLALAGEGDGRTPLGRLGDFQLLREIGHGGMGIVYEAEQVSLRRRVALKVLPFAAVLDPQHLQRFKNEAQAAASLDHPNIVTVYSVGCERGVHYYAMQYVEGQTLAAIIEGLKASSDAVVETSGAARSTTGLSRSLGSRELYRGVARLGIQAAEALEHAHRMGIVHRDIKPSNLMVDAEGRLWVTDFGLALSGADAKLTLTGDLVGTLRYMSPEQVEGRRQILDHATDIYSLGVTLYELLALRPAVTSAGRHEAMHQIVEHDPRPLVELDRVIPRDLDTIVLKCIAKDPSARYTTARDLAEDLRLFVDDRPIRARRPSLADRAARWGRRHRSLVRLIVVAIVVVMLVSAAIAPLVLNAYQREKELRAIADQNAHEAKDSARQVREKSAQSQANYEMARKAVKQVLQRVADEHLIRLPEMREVRRRILEDAAAFYADLLKVNPRDSSAYFERAGVYALLRQYDKVRGDCEKACEFEPENAQYHDRLAELLATCSDNTRRDLPCALIHANRAVRLEPRSAAYRYTLATVYLNSRENDKAADQMRQAAELWSEPIWRNRFLARACSIEGDLTGAVEWQQKALVLAPNDPGVQQGLGELLVSLGEYEKAIALLTNSIEVVRKNIDEWSESAAYMRYGLRADAYTGLKKYREALADYDRSLELAPFRSYTYKRRAATHFKLKNYDKALADIVKALELLPGDHAVTWIPAEEVAKCPDERFRKGLLDLADKYYRLNPGDDAWFQTRNRLYAALAPEETRRRFDDDLKRDPRNLAALCGRIDLSVAQHRVAEVMDDCRRLAEIKPDWPADYYVNYLAWRLCTNPLQANPGLAIELVKQAISLNPRKGNYWNTLGVAQYRLGDFRAAIQSLGKAMELRGGGGNAVDWLFTAMAHKKLGNTSEALRCYRKAEKTPDEREDLRRYRVEAIQLLGNPNVAPATQKEEANAKK